MKFYKYEETTKKYIGEIDSDTQPENSTSQKPSIFLNNVEVELQEPAFDLTLQSWVETYSALTNLQKQVAFLTAQIAKDTVSESASSTKSEAD